MKKFQLLFIFCCMIIAALAQETFPVNGVHDYREDYFAFTHATIVKDSKTTIKRCNTRYQRRKNNSVGNNVAVPKDAAVIDCKGKYIYPSFIDFFSDYGISSCRNNPNALEVFARPICKRYQRRLWLEPGNRPETDASKIFKANENEAKDLRSMGFGTVVSHLEDGIARGTGTLVTLSDEKENI